MQNGLAENRRENIDFPTEQLPIKTFNVKENQLKTSKQASKL